MAFKLRGKHPNNMTKGEWEAFWDGWEAGYESAKIKFDEEKKRLEKDRAKCTCGKPNGCSGITTRKAT